MTPLSVYQDSRYKTTAVSNFFIDEYMNDANAAQLRIYLYLLRQMGEGRSASVCEMADFFNYPEKDIIRALKYWENQGLLVLDMDEQNLLKGIRMCPFGSSPVSLGESDTPIRQKTEKQDTKINKETAIDKEDVSYKRPTCSLTDLKQFQEKDTTAELLYITEAYLKRQLTASEIKTLYFFSETLKMSNDLIDYLFQYCVGRGKTGFHYIESVAVNWVENGIKTTEDAKKWSYKYAKIVYTVMKALGKSTSPTDEEAGYVNTWSHDMGFSDDIILEACRRSVSGTDKNRMQYADKILKSWKESQVITLNDVTRLDKEFKESKTAAGSENSPQPSYKKSSFHKFEHRTYNFDAIEQQFCSK